MKQPRTQPGIAAAVLGVAIVASVGAVVSGPVFAPAQVATPSEYAAAAVDRKAVAKWLTGLKKLQRSDQFVSGRLSSAATAGDRSCEAARFVTSRFVGHQPTTFENGPPAAPVRPHLGDLSPPAC